MGSEEVAGIACYLIIIRVISFINSPISPKCFPRPLLPLIRRTFRIHRSDSTAGKKNAERWAMPVGETFKDYFGLQNLRAVGNTNRFIFIKRHFRLFAAADLTLITILNVCVCTNLQECELDFFFFCDARLRNGFFCSKERRFGM